MIRIWPKMYLGMPNSILVDQGSAFLSDEWRFGCVINNIELTSTGTESHNSLGPGETYHAYLRRIYLKLQSDFPKLTDEIILSLAVRAVNDCTGSHGLCPTLLVFGTLPQLMPQSKSNHKSQLDRHRAAAQARDEYERLVSHERINIAARKALSPADKQNFIPGDLVYVYRENERKCTGPHMVASAQGKNIQLRVGERTGPRPFNKAQIKPAPIPSPLKPKCIISELCTPKSSRLETRERACLLKTSGRNWLVY